MHFFIALCFRKWYIIREGRRDLLKLINKVDKMKTLRTALKESNWEAFSNTQNEEWNTSDLLNEFVEGESEWLDGECTVCEDGTIIDKDGDELSEIAE